jgi:hypothetical protein
MPLKPIEFLLDRSALGSEPFDYFLLDSATIVILLGEAPQRGGVIPIFIISAGEYAVLTLCWYWLLLGHLLRIFCRFLSPCDINGGAISDLLTSLIRQGIILTQHEYFVDVV